MAKAKKLPSGNWRVQAKCNGVIKSFTADNKHTAEMMALEWQSGLSAPADSITTKEYFNKYIDAKSRVLSLNTLHVYKMMRDTYLTEIMDIPLYNLTDEQIQIAVNNLSASRSPKTVRNAYGLLTAVISMFRPGYKPKITLPQRIKKEPTIPTLEEMKTLLKYTSDKNINLPIILAAFCGLREGEICALNNTDILDNKIHIYKSLVFDDATKQWITKPPKSFSGDRYVDIPDQIKPLLQQKEGRIVNYTPDGLRMVFKKTVNNLNMSHIRFHDLRHYYVSELYDMGLPEKYIIAQVGHSSASITKAIYDHLSKQKQSQYSSQIAAHFSAFE